MNPALKTTDNTQIQAVFLHREEEGMNSSLLSVCSVKSVAKMAIHTGSRSHCRITNSQGAYRKLLSPLHSNTFYSRRNAKHSNEKSTNRVACVFIFLDYYAIKSVYIFIQISYVAINIVVLTITLIDQMVNIILVIAVV